MPTYQYVCTDCDRPLEAVQSFTDDALTECPSCGGRLRKVFSAVGVVFKGSGFYRTDSRAGTSDKGGDKGGDKGAAKGGEKKADAAAKTSEPANAASSASSGASSGTSGSSSGSSSTSGSTSAA